MNDLSLTVLELVRNSIEAHADQIFITINIQREKIDIVIHDNGTGFQDHQHIFDKHYSTKNNKRGMGLYLLKQELDKNGGYCKVYDHTIDIHYCQNQLCPPLGLLEETCTTLLLEDIDLYFIYIHDDYQFSFSSQSLKQMMNFQDLNNPKILIKIKQYLKGGFV